MPRRDWKKRMWRRIVIRILILLVLLSAAAVGIWGFLLPYLRAESAMITGQMLLQHMKDGGISLTWPAADKCDYYLVEVLLPRQNADSQETTETDAQVIHSQEISEGNTCVLQGLPLDEELTIRINTMVRYETPREIRVRPGGNPLECTMRLEPPTAKDVQWVPDPEADSAKITFTMVPGDKTRLWYHNGDENWQQLKTVTSGEAIVSFGHDGDLPMPQHGETYHFCLDSYREQPGSIYYSRTSKAFKVVREDLLDRNLWMQLTDLGDNVCSLVWNETKGEYYELQMKSGDRENWVTLCTVPKDGDRSFTTGHLQAFRDYSFRVIAQGGQAASNKPAAVSEDITFQTKEVLLYTTIWPIKDLDVYADPEMTEAIGKVRGGQNLCILEVHEKSFGIRFSEEVTGYVDSRYVMIDLAEYLGELCAYDITNSYSSLFMVNEYEMEDITEEVIKGYENVRLSDGSYLVPLLYPVAQRLMVAAQNAREAGYRLKIYDAYRPNRATVMLYDDTEAMLEEPVPGEIPDPTAEDPEQLLTYGAVMTDYGNYPLNYFLAQGASLHNLGIALDLTIEKWDTGEEQEMQTAMHDLSHFSMVYRNNHNAKLLKQFMEGAGFGGLISEWWHFQDNEVRKELSLPALWGGINAEGWKLSDGGWRFRLKNGTYAVGGLQVGDTAYYFDEAGYLIE